MMVRTGVTLLLLLQMAGVITVALTLYDGEAADCTETCADDEASGMPCPPFCSTCTCLHGRAAGLPVQVASRATICLPSRSDSPPSSVDIFPESPDSDSIFHPPRG